MLEYATLRHLLCLKNTFIKAYVAHHVATYTQKYRLSNDIRLFGSYGTERFRTRALLNVALQRSFRSDSSGVYLQPSIFHP